MLVADARAPASGHRISAGAGASWLRADACDPGLGDVECTLDADRALSWTPRTSDGSSRNGHAFGRPPPSRPGPDPVNEELRRCDTCGEERWVDEGYTLACYCMLPSRLGKVGDIIDIRRPARVDAK